MQLINLDALKFTLKQAIQNKIIDHFYARLQLEKRGPIHNALTLLLDKPSKPPKAPKII